MEIVKGKQSVWQHAGEAGMQDDIRLITKYFDIKDIAIIFNGKMSYIEDKPQHVVRVKAIPKPESFSRDLDAILKQYRDSAKKGKR